MPEETIYGTQFESHDRSRADFGMRYAEVPIGTLTVGEAVNGSANTWPRGDVARYIVTGLGPEYRNGARARVQRAYLEACRPTGGFLGSYHPEEYRPPVRAAGGERV